MSDEVLLELEKRFKSGVLDVSFWELLNTVSFNENFYEFLLKERNHESYLKQLLHYEYRAFVDSTSEKISDFLKKLRAADNFPLEFIDVIITEGIKSGKKKAYITSTSDLRKAAPSFLGAVTLDFNLTNEQVEKILKVDAFALRFNKFLTKEQIFKYLEYDEKNRIFFFQGLRRNREAVRFFKQRNLTFTLSMKWSFVKKGFDFEDETFYKNYKKYLKNVDMETFNILEENWEGSLQSLIEVCENIGPDKI